MKRTATILAAIVLLLSLNSCLLTLYPIYTAKDVVFREDLLGNFIRIEKENEKQTMQITPLSDYKGDLPAAIRTISNRGYLITQRDEEENIFLKSVVFAVQLGNGLYLDFLPLRSEKSDEYYESLRIPMHAAYRVKSLDANGFVLQRFSSGFLTGLIEKNRIRISNENVNNQRVITASTEQLQDYIRKYGHLEEAYETDLETYSKK